MSDVILIDRFTRQNLSISGRYCPRDLPRLAEYLAGPDGEIAFSLAGSLTTDLMGSQKRCIKCIISGWFLLADPVTSHAKRRECQIESRLVVVGAESELPPLEMESDDEDYIVCGAELDVMERVEEEILLDLPAAFGGQIGPVSGPKTVSSNTATRATIPGAVAGKISPFAKLAELKKK